MTSKSKASCSSVVQTISLLAAIVFFAMLPARSQQYAGTPMFWLDGPTAEEHAQLPAGDGKQIVESSCTFCHNLDRTINGHRYRDSWQNLVDKMVSYGAPVKNDQVPVLVDYLAKNFVGVPVPEGVVVPGSVKVNIKEWKIPNPQGNPHDPMVAPDDTIWFTSQPANMLGRFDPKTGEFKDFPMKTPKSAPHGLVADKEGFIWFTASLKDYVGRLDSKTGEITQYPFPDRNAVHPHTPIIAQKGEVVFTVMYGNMLGKVNPKTGDVKLAKVPTPRSDPYGLVLDSKGLVYFAESATNKLASFNPDTMEIKEFVIPHAKARARRLAFTSDGILWYSDIARGYLGRFDPKTGRFSEFPSPSGPYSAPYGLTTVGNIVWYSETGTKHNTIVRFDPATEKFQSWLIPSGGVVRNMMPAKDGNVWIAGSGVNTIAMVEVKKN